MTIDNVGLIRLYYVALDKHRGSTVNVSVNVKRSQFSFLFAGPSSAFEKWSGHEISKTFNEWRRHELGESTRGGIPPLVRGVRGISPEKILYFRTSTQTILMHFGTVFALEALLIL